jgi:hypothetical protein
VLMVTIMVMVVLVVQVLLSFVINFNRRGI